MLSDREAGCHVFFFHSLTSHLYPCSMLNSQCTEDSIKVLWSVVLPLGLLFYSLSLNAKNMSKCSFSKSKMCPFLCQQKITNKNNTVDSSSSKRQINIKSDKMSWMDFQGDSAALLILQITCMICKMRSI